MNEDSICLNENNVCQKSIDSFLNDIKFGKYQILICIIVGFYVVCDSAQILAMPFLNMDLQMEWNLTNSQVIIIGTVFFGGFFLGSIIAGFLSNNFGRKCPFLIALMFFIMIGLTSTLSIHYKTFLIFRFSLGVCLGILVPLTTLIILECCSNDMRGRVMVFITGVFVIGQLYFLWIVFSTSSSFSKGNWRQMMVWISLTAIIPLVIGIFCLKESPRYALFNNFEEGVNILNAMYKTNQGDDKEFSNEDIKKLEVYVNILKKSNEFQSSNVGALFQGQSTKITLLLWIIWIVIFFTYLGIVYIYPTILNTLNGQSSTSDKTDYFAVLMSILSDIPAYFVVYFTVDSPYFGRKMSLFWAFLFGGIVLIATYWTQGYLMIFSVFMSKFFLNVVIIVIFPFTFELYPTKNRAIGIGLCGTLSRIFGIIMPFVSMSAYEISIMLPFLVYGILALMAAGATILLPHDTYGKEMDTKHSMNQEEGTSEEKEDINYD